MKHEEYVAHDATGLALLIREGKVSAQEVAAAAAARIDAVNPTINAVVQQFAPFPANPEGPFAGVPFLLKDMDGWLAGVPCTYSSRSLADWVPSVTSELIARYQDAGLQIMGKTNCPEFGTAGTTEPELHGPTRNPWNTDHIPGGSSGGSAAAVAAGIVPTASAGDGAGSIRIPASACGLFGLKPTRGLTPLAPEANPSLGLVTRHVITRSVRDSAALLNATTAPFTGSLFAQPARPRSYLLRLQRPPRRLRVGVSRRSFLDEPLHPDCAAAVDDAAELLESLGHRVVELELPMPHEEVARAFLTIMAASIAAEVAATEGKTGRPPKPSMFEQPTWFLKQVGEAISARELYEAQQVAGSVAQSFGEVFGAQIDVHLSATMAAPPAKIGELGVTLQQRVALGVLQRVPVPSQVLRKALAELAHDSLERTPNTAVFNLTGQPAMSVPLYWNQQNLPIGVQIAGAFGSEELLLRLAEQLHEARPWFSKLPMVTG